MTYKEEVYDNFVRDFSLILREKTRDLELSKLIFLCIGTDRVIGDSFGPLVGYKLEKLYKNESNIKVIGTLQNIICMQNALGTIDKIYNTYEEPFIIVIDAALSNTNSIGIIVVSKNKMNIGASFRKKNIYVGDISIKGIVSKDLASPKCNFKLLQNTSLRFNYEYGRYRFYAEFIM